MLSLFAYALTLEDSKGEIVKLALHTMILIFKRAAKFYKTRYNHEISVAFEAMHGIDSVEKLLYHPSNPVYKLGIKFLERNFEKIETSMALTLTALYK
jgi:hypothetical protein